MGDERLLLRARLTQNKASLHKMDLRADTHIRTIRETLDPLLGKHFTELDMEAAKVAFDDFYELWVEGNELKELIKKQEQALE